MKKQVQTTLLLLLSTAVLCAQTPKALLNEAANAYGIEPEANYSGREVLEILLTAEDEAAVCVREAYTEGYKAGVAEYAPRCAQLEAVNASLMAEITSVKSSASLPSWVLPVTGICCASLGFAAGVLTAR